MVHPRIVALYAAAQFVGRIPLASGWRSLRDTADALDAMATTVHICRLLRFVLDLLAISLPVPTLLDTPLSDLIGSNMFAIPSNHERPGNIGCFALCAVTAERQ